MLQMRASMVFAVVLFAVAALLATSPGRANQDLPPAVEPSPTTRHERGPVRDPRPFPGVRKISYGSPQTITGFQAGQIIVQHVGAYFVRSELGPHWMDLKFKIDGRWRRFKVPTQSMSCLVEDMGEESVPILVSRR